MKTYDIYRHPEKGFEIVKHGFSWPALFFGGFWLIFKELYVNAGIWFLIAFALRLTKNSSQILFQSMDGLIIIFDIGILILFLVPAYTGYNWIMNKLIKNGYNIIETVDVVGKIDYKMELERINVKYGKSICDDICGKKETHFKLLNDQGMDSHVGECINCGYKNNLTDLNCVNCGRPINISA